MLRSSRSAGLALPVKFDGPGVLTRLVGSNRNPCPAWTERAIASFIAGLIPGLSGDGSGDRKSDAPLLATTSIHWLVCLQSTARVITTISGSIWEKVRCWVILFASVLTAKVSRPLPIAPACIVPDALRFEDASCTPGWLYVLWRQPRSPDKGRGRFLHSCAPVAKMPSWSGYLGLQGRSSTSEQVVGRNIMLNENVPVLDGLTDTLHGFIESARQARIERRSASRRMPAEVFLP